MTRIIAPIDFSSASLNAARYAARLADAMHKELMLIHIVQIPVVYGDVPMMPATELNQAEQQAGQELSKLAFLLNEQMEGRLAIYTATRIGNPVSELLAISRSKDVYAIVISSHGAGSVERLLVGSTTNSLARDAECPVLVVPADINFSKPEKIGLASDFREVVKHTPQKTIIALLDAFGAKLEILHADPDFHEFEPATMEEGLMLDTMFEDHRPSFRFLHSGYTEESILTYAAEHYIDMLVVVPKEHGFAERLFRHQHTETFLKEATLPILVLKGKLD